MNRDAGLLGRGDFPFRLVEPVRDRADQGQVVVRVARPLVAGEGGPKFDLGFVDSADLEESRAEGQRDSGRGRVRLFYWVFAESCG